MSSTSNLASASTDELRSKLVQLRADKALLTSQLSSLRALPDSTPEAPTLLSIQNEELGRKLRSLEEKSILYRSAAWTCFELDLDVGRRARQARDTASADKDGDLALGIRLDTFFRGRFYEPYYLVFARPSQLLDSMPQLAGTAVGDVEANSLADGLRLIRHTVPHFVPLAKLVEKYLPSVMGGHVSGGAGSKGRDNKAGGLTMLTQFNDLPGLHAFLSDLHCHLQAYVSRRQQAIALQDLELGGESEKAEAPLEALGTEAFDLVKVTWRIPSTTAQADQEADDAEDDSTNPTALALKAAAKRKRENRDDEPSQYLELVVQYHDLQSDRLVDETRPTSIPAEDSSDDVEAAVDGLRKRYGTVRVQLLEYAPELETRQRRAPGISTADLKALRPTITRREDLEQMYAHQDDGESLDMDQAFQRIAKRVWGQLRGKNSECERSIEMSRSQARVAWSAREVHEIRRMLWPRIDPRIYRFKTPNFRQLAIKYPSFSAFVKDSGGYEAKIDFQDSDAVRCLAQTLLLDDFGIHATLSPSNLCPMIPNRLAYISFVYELLSWTLPTWYLLELLRRRPLELRVRGLDVGTGASAIYPVLGAACFRSWQFTATDIDEESLEYARKNVVGCASDEVKGRIELVDVGEGDAFVPVGVEGRYDFTMCNPPFYSSRQEMDELARFKKQPANAVCHGTPSEMIVTGGEVSFVQRMMRESITSRKVLWWTCMLGKLSSVVTLSGELKQLAMQQKVAGWGVHELHTGGGKTKRWVIMWTVAAATGLRIPDRLSRDGLPSSLEKNKPVSTEQCGNVLKLGSGWTRKELLEATTRILDELEGCSVYPSAYQQVDDLLYQSRGGRNTETAMTADTGAIDVIVTKESWTRKARRAKLQTAATSTIAPPQAPSTEPLLMARILFSESQDINETGLVVKVNWTYGMDAVKFESFAMFLLAAVERRVTEDAHPRSQ